MRMDWGHVEIKVMEKRCGEEKERNEKRKKEKKRETGQRKKDTWIASKDGWKFFNIQRSTEMEK